MAARDVPAVVLAAGEGQRLAPLTNNRPKPMVPVANRPILEHVLVALRAAGIDRVVFVVGYRADRIRTHFGDGDDWDVDIDYVEQQPQLGTGHALLQASSAVEGPFLVLNGDRVVDPAIVENIRSKLLDGAHPVVSVITVEHPSHFGVVQLEGGQVAHIEEQPVSPNPTELINAGVYGFRRSIFERIAGTETTNGEWALTDALNELADEAPLSTVRCSTRWLDVTFLWDLPVVNAELVTGGDAPGVDTTAPDVSIASNASVADGARVIGGTSIGANARIGANAVLENTVILPGARIGPGSVVRNAVVGEGANLGAGVIMAGEDATVTVDDRVYEEIDLGGVVGDYATVGDGVRFAPGAILGEAADVATGAVVAGRIPDDGLVRRG